MSPRANVSKTAESLVQSLHAASEVAKVRFLRFRILFSHLSSRDTPIIIPHLFFPFFSFLAFFSYHKNKQLEQLQNYSQLQHALHQVRCRNLRPSMAFSTMQPTSIAPGPFDQRRRSQRGRRSVPRLRDDYVGIIVTHGHTSRCEAGYEVF